MGERDAGSVEARGSSPLTSTKIGSWEQWPGISPGHLRIGTGLRLGWGGGASARAWTIQAAPPW